MQFRNAKMFVLGNTPCILNCRPLGQLFYASLAMVADGTPCTKPGFRATCIQGVCKVSSKWLLLIYRGMFYVLVSLRCGPT